MLQIFTFLFKELHKIKLFYLSLFFLSITVLTSFLIPLFIKEIINIASSWQNTEQIWTYFIYSSITLFIMSIAWKGVDYTVQITSAVLDKNISESTFIQVINKNYDFL